MKRTERLVLLAVLVMSLMALCGCSTKEEPMTESKKTSESGSTDSLQNTLKNRALKIAIVSSPSGVDDGSFNQDIYRGIQDYIKENQDASVTPVRETTGDTSAAVSAVADIVADYDVIVCCGFQFSGVGTIAVDNPGTNFILVDAAAMDEEGNEVTADNIYAMTFAEQESGFFAGVAAALETKTGKVAVVNGVAFPSNVNYQYGFEAGVGYAVKHLKAKAQCVALPSYSGTDSGNQSVGGNYIGSFADEATGKVVGNALIKEGCDILFAAAGASGNGVFTASKEAGNVKVIGCDVDQYEDGALNSENIVLTSVLKLMGKNVKLQLEAIRDDKFQGGNKLLMADTDSTGYVSAQGRHQMNSETLDELEDVYEDVKEGEIVPPSSYNQMKPDQFTGL